MTYIKLNSKEYKELGTYKKDEILTSMAQIERYFEDIHYYYEDDYPDDAYKTSVCIGFKNEETNNIILLWDYKYWNYNDEQIDGFEFIDFSVYYENEEDFIYFKNLLEDEI